MFKTLKEAFKIKEVRKKILITLLLLLIYRIGCWLPTPGLAISTFQSSVTSGGDFLSVNNIFLLSVGFLCILYV